MNKLFTLRARANEASSPAATLARSVRRLILAMLGGLAISLMLVTGAFAHARMSPAISLSNELQLYSLGIPTEKANAYTTKIVLTLPKNFSIDSFVPSPGWKRVEQQTGSGDSAVITQVTWTGGHVPTEEDSLFQFLAQPAKPGTYTFQVEQTYSDGSIVNWSGPETSAAPAPSIKVVSSVGGGGASTLTVIALVLGAVGVLIGGVALFTRGGGSGGRQLA